MKTKDYVRFALAIPLCAFIVMIGIGMWHDIWPKVPPIGYWPCLGIAACIFAVSWSFHRPRGRRA